MANYTTINKSTDYFNTSTWTATTSAISNLNFSPDWVWIKSTDSGNGHILFDTIRGANIRLSTAVTSEEFTRTDELMSFDSNGYTLGSSGNTNDTNPFNASYVGWSWRGSDSSAVSNTDGSITSTVSANTTSGFSIVSYTGNGSASTIGHGLGTTPSMIIVKKRSVAGSWYVYHQSIGNTKRLVLDTTSAETTDANAWNNTSPTSSVFSVGASGTTNASGATHIAYCFAEKTGYSKFGSYTGNGNADGTFVYTGFKPAFVIIKDATNAYEWRIYDNKINSFNSMFEILNPNNNNAQATTSHGIDFLSNGFKCRGTTTINTSGANQIYMCFAEAPIVGTNNVPCTAR